MKFILIIFLSLLTFSVLSQEKINDSLIAKNTLDRCVQRDSSERLIDFSIYSKVAVCSMELYCKKVFNKRGKVIRESCWANTFIEDGKLLDSSFIEIKFLNDSSKVELNSILHSKKKNDNSHIRCYNPRNAILFFDDNGKIKDCLEICFECEGNRTTFSGIYQFDLCSDQYIELKNFIGKMGVKRGIEEIKR